MSKAKLVNAEELIEICEIYKLIGIDMSKISMPHIERCPISHTSGIIANPESLEYFIFSRLNPALQTLAISSVLKQSAPYFDSQIKGAEHQLIIALNDLSINAGMKRYDPQSLTAVTEFSGKYKESSFDDLDAISKEIAESISQRFTEKLSVLEQGHKKSSQKL